MVANIDHIAYTLAPLKFFYFVSTTSASLSQNKLLRSWPYRIYLIVAFTIPAVVIGYLFHLEKDHMKFSPFNYNILCVYYILLQYILMIYPILKVKKMRVQKVIQAIEEIDFKLHFKNFALCKKIRHKIALWVTILILSHILVHSVLVVLLLNINGAYFFILMSSWLKYVEVSMDTELSCVTCFSWLLYYRAESFLSHLDEIVQTNAQTDLNLLLCHRQLHFVLKKINKAWKPQVTAIFYIITFQALRNLLLIFLHLNDTYLVLIASILVVRYLTVFIPLCIVGQQLGNTFDKIHVTANIMKDSLTLSREHVRSGASMCLEGALRVRRLRGMSGLQFDAKLPLKVFASIGTILVFMLQMGIDFTAHNL